MTVMEYHMKDFKLAGTIPALALMVSASSAVVLSSSTAGATTLVEGFGAGSPWQQTEQAGDGSVEIEDLSGAGGNLENNAPLPTGAVRFETSNDNADRAEIAVGGNYGLVSDIFTNDLNFGYSVFKEETGEAFAAPSMKLAFFNGDVTTTGDDRGFTQLIFEPNWNQPGNAGSSTAVPTGDWVDYSFDLNNGVLGSTRGFGSSNAPGGPPLLTLQGWLDEFNDDFPSATLLSVSIGLGTFNPNNIGYVDNVEISGTLADATYDFEAVTPVPVPAALPLLLAGLGGLGLAARRKRKAA
jgi:hypothetical protein